MTQQIQAGKIEAVQLPTGELLVAAESNGHELKTKKEIIAEKFAHLLRQQITIAEATRKYEIPRTTLLGWIELGYIEVVEKRHPKGINEADVAYCSRIYHEREGKRGSRLFDENGNPYRLKRPDIAEYRRRKQIKT
ncbi:MAG: hypothetical protein HC875_40065 [Anaerolineales bacterium]|nr:hypothetical protein [Anaerolineales bacterium]